jgi:tetratricopeptide (TPR) repeat protein
MESIILISQSVLRSRVGASWRPGIRGALLCSALLLTRAQCLAAQASQTQSETSITIRGHVVDSAGSPVTGAEVQISGPAAVRKATVLSQANGAFVFRGLPIGIYVLISDKSGMRSQPSSVDASKPGDQTQVKLVLEDAIAAESSASSQPMEFSDQPTFTVAGVTDWTAAGGHGSDAILRTSEALTRETLNLKQTDRNVTMTSLGRSATSENATNHRLAGDKDEKAGDSLAAVRDYEEAVRLDPSEENYFAWGSELLLHRAIWQAKDVFEKGVLAHPESVRLLTGLASALFAAALYDEAARRLCEASDLNPAAREPYIFMGRVEIASPNPLACVEPRLERFVQRDPQDPLANYFYAMAIWKQHGQPLVEPTARRIHELLTNSVTIDPKSGDGYLQLGNLEAAQRDYQVAIDFYAKAIDVNPQLSEAHYRLAIAYDRIGDQERAKQEFQRHDELEKEQSAEVDRQRREIKQFIVTVPEKPAGSKVQ